MHETATPQAECKREQYFTVVIARHVFAHRTHGIVFVPDAMSLADAKKYGLQPLILYSVTPATAVFRCSVVAPLDNPLGLGAALETMWHSCEQLRGVPDVLRVSRHVAAACPNLGVILRQAGVELVIADGHDKRFGAAVRNAQSGTFGLIRPRSIKSQDALNAAFLYRAECDARIAGYRGHAVRDTIAQWLSLPHRPLQGHLDTGDWVKGPWLHSWEANLPPAGDRHMHTDKDGSKWLLIGQSEDADQDMQIDSMEPPDNFTATVKTMLNAWPNKPAEVARAAGITARELQWFINERAELPTKSEGVLREILGIRFRRDAGYFEASGPCTLIATSRASIEAYEEISGGGDLDFSFEVVPEGATADPSWRYVLFQPCCCLPCIMMFPRGGKIEPTSKAFINLDDEPCAIPAKLYQDIVATAGRACISPEQNVHEMLLFADRHRETWDEFERRRFW